ncbi:MAG: AmmeMemoRadiSam system radical SAM enzyme [Endomicrobia bacterium]|nr:AmmeMemoRadiSam system radical SAM enzyme [Endomicrobiia bacterium]
MKEATHYLVIDQHKNILQCRLCPHNCIIEENKVGKCKARKNINGKLYSLTYGVISSIAFDPIEKKPLYHFYPGSLILSVGSFGCNFKCEFCQNWEISQIENKDIDNFHKEKIITTQQLLQIAKKYKSNIGISYTYNEPLINFEFVLDTAKIFNKEGYKNVLVTNGYINKEPLLELIPYIDAANIDLKSFNENFYKEICGAKLKFVLETIEIFLRHKKHIELTTLVITQANDSIEEITQIVNYVSSLSSEIPLHFSRYFPMYKFSKPSTSVEHLMEIYKLAKQKLKYVYLGNVVYEEYNSTFCPNCNKLLIKRVGYNVEIMGLKNRVCKYCGEEIKIVI